MTQAIENLSDLEEALRHLIVEQTSIALEKIRLDSHLVADLGINSLEMTELIMACEEEFDVTLPDEGDNAVYQTLFNRSGTVAELAELIFIQRETKRVPRDDWEGEPPELPTSKSVPFTQLGSRLSDERHGKFASEGLYDDLGKNEQGYATFRRRTDGMLCVEIPAAQSVQLGNPDHRAPADQQPARTVAMSAFLMDAEPISATAFSRFLNSINDGAIDTGILKQWFLLDQDEKRKPHEPIRRDDNGKWMPHPAVARWPMMLISWFGANAYALWAHGRDWRRFGVDDRFLPSEAQWEYAARGTEFKPFPWGDATPTPDRLRVAQHRIRQTYTLEQLPLADVNACLGESPFGLRHMAGNVWHWCRDYYSADFAKLAESRHQDPCNRHETNVRSERGGSWIGPAELAHCSFRRARDPLARGRCLGFRCCSPLPTQL